MGWGGDGRKDSGGGGDLTNIQCKATWNYHNEYHLHMLQSFHERQKNSIDILIQWISLGSRNFPTFPPLYLVIYWYQLQPLKPKPNMTTSIKVSLRTQGNFLLSLNTPDTLLNRDFLNAMATIFTCVFISLIFNGQAIPLILFAFYSTLSPIPTDSPAPIILWVVKTYLRMALYIH
jgi:hypothetical protein